LPGTRVNSTFVSCTPMLRVSNARACQARGAGGTRTEPPRLAQHGSCVSGRIKPYQGAEDEPSIHASQSLVPNRRPAKRGASRAKGGGPDPGRGRHAGTPGSVFAADRACVPARTGVPMSSGGRQTACGTQKEADRTLAAYDRYSAGPPADRTLNWECG
jgi:hypothetical protein